jgi:Protein of unknown function (DUF2913)
MVPDDGWTLGTLKALVDEREQAAARLAEERDRRYAEVNVEKEKALKIKETADLAALQLARADQTYKDEQANKLREQINSERNVYVTQDQLAAAVREMSSLVKPVSEYVTGQQSVRQGNQDGRLLLGTLIGAGSLLVAVVAFILTR